VRQFAWRPDGQALAFAAPDEVPEKKDEAKFEDAFEVGNNSYLERTAAVPVHLWTISASGGEAKRLTSGTWSLPVHAAPSGPPSEIAYTPDGRSLVFVRAESPTTGESESSRLEMMDVSSGAMHPLTKATIAEEEPRLSPDGTQIAYSFPRDGKRRNEASVYLVPSNGAASAGVGKNATYALDHAVGAAGWMPDGASLLVSGPDGTKVGMWVQPLQGPAKKLELGGLVPGGATVGKDGAIAFTATDAMHAPELFYLAHAGDAPVQMTHLQTVLDGKTLGKQETVTWKSDKFTVDGVLTYPPDYVSGKKYPMVLYLHGGPTATSLETFTTASQVLAAKGWLVFEPNYRGSDNAGNAFEASIVNDASAGPGRDIMAGVKALEARGLVDETRIAVSGWSYGGQMTAWMIGNYPSVWKAAVAGAPVTDLVDQYTLSDNNVERAAGYGPSPFVGDNLKSYALQSPITYLYRVKTPTLIMSDVGDWRVTTTQAYKLYHALKDNGVPVKFVAFPVPGHSPADPIRSREVWRRWTAWLEPYLNGPVAEPNAATSKGQ
jgi:dipeptidyl aminopeptidase/acylaminoacyl peptidase